MMVLNALWSTLCLAHSFYLLNHRRRIYCVNKIPPLAMANVWCTMSYGLPMSFVLLRCASLHMPPIHWMIRNVRRDEEKGANANKTKKKWLKRSFIEARASPTEAAEHSLTISAAQRNTKRFSVTSFRDNEMEWLCHSVPSEFIVANRRAEDDQAT